MAKYTDVMRWVAELDNRDVLKGFKEIESEGKKSLDSVGDESEGLGDRFKGAGGKMGKALVAGFAAVGVGAILLNEIDKAFSRQDSLNVVTGRFALTAEEARKYGKIAGDLYADGWGEGIEEVQQAVAVTFEKLEIDSEEAGKKLARDALAVSKTWGTDVDAVIRSVGQLMKNDLVDDAEEGMDLVVAAFQNGGDEAGDLLDTIDEYAPHWQAMGLSGEDALNQVIAGFQNGQRDADKMGDAVKEMGLRIREGTDPVREALQDIGLDADDVIEAFLEGGPRAREAFLDVVEALKDGQEQGDDTENAVALIGTQFEDLGPTALTALGQVDGALENTEGKAEDLAGAVGATEWEKFQRNAESALGAVGNYIASEVNPAFEAANSLWGAVFGDDSTDGAGGSVVIRDALADVNTEVGNLIDSIPDAVRETEELDDEFRDAERGAGDFYGTLGDLVDEHYDSARAMEEARRKAQALTDENRRLHESARELLGGELEVNAARRDARAAALELDGALGELEQGTDDYRGAIEDAAGKQLEAAEAAVEYKLKQMEANGQTITAETQSRLMREELGRLAGQLSPDSPLLVYLQGWIDKLNAIPSNKTTTIGITHSGGGNVNTGARGGGRGSNVAAADGAVFNRPTLTWMGDGGEPEYAIPASKLPGNDPLPDLSRLGGGGATINLTVNAGMGTDGAAVGRQITEVLESYFRNGGQIPPTLVSRLGG